MHGITPQTAQKLKDPNKAVCAFWKENECRGKITISHPLKYAGKQLKTPWSEILACQYHHSVGQYMDCGDYNEEKHQWCALNQASVEELKKYSKARDLVALRANLNEKYENTRQGN